MMDQIQPTITPVILFKRYLGKIFSTTAGLVLFVLFLRFFVVSPGVVNGPSMEPSFIDEDLFFVNKFIYLFSPPRRGDVVEVVDLSNKKLVIKRIIALPEEIVSIKRGKVYVRASLQQNEWELPEKYLKVNTYTLTKDQVGAKHFLVPPMSYFVMGDNRDNSVDSRVYGPINRSNIIGKVFGLIIK